MEDWKVELETNIDLFQPVKRNWQPDELAIAYRIYNGYYGTAIRDTGCGSCRRSVLQHLIKIAEEYRKSRNS
jgi:hypothetical protein